MARRPASITQADFARIIRAAKQAGVAEAEVRLSDGSTIVLRFEKSTGDETGLAAGGEVVL